MDASDLRAARALIRELARELMGGSDLGGPTRSPGRVLLVTRALPGSAGTSGQLLGALVDLLPRSACVVAKLERDSDGSVGAGLRQDPFRVAELRWRRFQRFGPFLRGALQGLGCRALRYRAVPALVGRLAELAKKSECELLWLPLNSPTALQIAEPLRRATGLPLIATVWDPPEHVLRYWRFEGAGRDGLLRQFAATLRGARRVSVVSDAMAREYQARHGADCVVLFPSTAPGDWWPSGTGFAREGWLTLGYAGALYAEDEWRTLLMALDALDWRVGDRRVEIRVMTNRLELEGTRERYVVYLGWRDPSGALAELARCDFGYVPYWFADQYRDTVRLSFPSKIPFYCASGRPILFHGPASSSPVELLEREGFGAICCEPGVEAMKRCLVELGRSSAALAAMSVAVARVRSELFSPLEMTRAFATLLGCDPGSLGRAADRTGAPPWSE